MSRGPQSLPLFAPAPLEAPRIERTPVRSRPQLWLAACLPSLALECLSAARAPKPVVVVELQQGQSFVVAVNREASNAGISRGNKLGTATTLAASLQIFERAPHLERASLESLARWAEGLTSLVSIESSEGVLLEVAGSLKLFGSLEAIKAKVRDELAKRAFDVRLGVAPTATAALWLARGAGADALQTHELASRLGRLPLEVTHWPPAVQALLKDLGLKTVGDCARLPRDGFARRVGNAYLVELDRALGRRVDLRVEYRAPRVWGSRIELDEESVDSALFMEVIEQQLDELAVELRRRQAQIDRLTIAFEHLHRSPTIESFSLLEPTHERERLLALVGDRLTRCLLPVPAVALQLCSAALQPLTQTQAGISDLFEAKPIEELVRVLLERLRERFGTDAVYGLRAVAEHRPERAWAKNIGLVGRRARDEGRDARGRAMHGAIADGDGVPWGQARPLWLLAKPVSLAAERAELDLSGPERIESGWWDERDVGRDYYTAKNPQGQRLWVFRDRKSHDWFLHGFFG